MLSINSIGRKCHGNSICKYSFSFGYEISFVASHVLYVLEHTVFYIC